MALKVTRQFGEVMGSSEGELRVTRQYMEVLALSYITYEESVENSLGISDTVHLPERHERVETVISLNETLPGEFREGLSDSLSFIQTATRVQTAELESTIEFLEDWTNYLNVGEHISLHESLTLTDGFEFELGLFFMLTSPMSLSQSVVDIGPRYRTLWTRIHLHDGMPFEDKFERLTDTFNLLDYAGRPYEVAASSTLSLIQDAYRKQTPTTIINFVQSLDYGKTKGLATQELNLEQLIDLQGDWTRTIIQTSGIEHSLTYYLPDPCDKKAYTPFVGESTVSSNPTPPNNTPPLIQGLPDGERFLLLHPALGEATDIVELRAPNLDNRERQAFTRINRETRGGKLSVFADPTWPQVNTLVLSFSGLTKAEVEETQEFMLVHLGEEIGIIDWEGRQWAGIVTNPNERAVQDGKRSFTLTFEFEGVLVETTPSGSHMIMSDGFEHVFDKARGLSTEITWTHFTQRWLLFPRLLEDVLGLTDEVDEELVPA